LVIQQREFVCPTCCDFEHFFHKIKDIYIYGFYGVLFIFSTRFHLSSHLKKST
jgi:hypothetical protein